MLQTCEENTLPHIRFEKEVLLLVRELEGRLYEVDGRRRLAQEYLDRRVGYHRRSVRRGEEVVHVLRDRREAEIVFTAAFRDTEEEGGGILRLHHPPRLVDDEQSLTEFLAHGVPDVVRDDVHRDRLQVIFHVAHAKDNQLLVHVHVRRPVHKARPRSLRVFRKTCDQRLAPLHAGEHELEVGKKWRLDRREVRGGGEVFESIGLRDRLIDDRVFFRREAAEHDAEETDERDDVVAQDVGGGLVLARDGEIERVNVVLGGERDVEIAAADGFREIFVFALWVNDDDFRIEHEGAQDLQFRGVRIVYEHTAVSREKYFIINSKIVDVFVFFVGFFRDGDDGIPEKVCIRKCFECGDNFFNPAQVLQRAAVFPNDELRRRAQ